MENNCLTKTITTVSAPWENGYIFPRRRWREQCNLKMNELHGTGLTSMMMMMMMMNTYDFNNL
jgi:hypothetical protein